MTNKPLFLRPAGTAIAAVLVLSATPTLAQQLPGQTDTQVGELPPSPPAASSPSPSELVIPRAQPSPSPSSAPSLSPQSFPLPGVEGTSITPVSPSGASSPLPGAASGSPAYSPPPASANTPVIAPRREVVQSIPEPTEQTASENASAQTAAPAPAEKERAKVTERWPADAYVATPVRTDAAAETPDGFSNESSADDSTMTASDTANTDVVPALAPPAAEPATASDPGLDSRTLWIVGGGAGLLLAGLGAFAVVSGRKRPTTVRKVTPVTAKAVAPVPARATTSVEPVRPVTVAPVRAASPEPVVATSFTPQEVAAAAPATPPAAVARTQPVTSDRWPELEAMIAAEPTPENPFVTRKQRLRRATYILAHGAPEPMRSDRVDAPVTAPARVAQPATSKSQPVYDFGKDKSGSGRLPGFKPATT